jgi:GTPase
MPETAPHPLLGTLHQPPLDRIAVQVAQLLDQLALTPRIEVIVAFLPERAASGKRLQLTPHVLLEHLNRQRQTASDKAGGRFDLARPNPYRVHRHMAFHSGFVCILGRPNAGKSTLLNALVGQKLAIISPKPQTTRNRILGIIHLPQQKGRAGGQVVLIDTPGVHKPDSSLGRKMMGEVREALEGCDLILMIADVAGKFAPGDQFVLDLVKRSKTPALLLLNKIDLLRHQKEKLLPIIDEYRRLHDFKEIIPLSARKGEGLDVLLEKVIEALPEGPRYFPEDQVTDQPVRFMVAEVIREQVLLETKEEVPYATTVVVEQFEEGAKLTRIAAAIYCEREGQKGILVGKRGAMLKKIGTAARLQIEKMVGTRVFLELFVKVQPGWRESHHFVEELDWRRQLQHLAGTEKA